MIRKNSHCSTKERDRLFEELAAAQRYKPEEAMLKLQHSQIAQEYGWLCEHVGDLTHRMSEKFSWFKGNYHNVGNKVDKTLRVLQRAAVNMDRQIRSNVAYVAEQGDDPKYPKTVAEAEDKLYALGRAYAMAHSKLRVYNKAQAWARGAAIALGRQDFDMAGTYLYNLQVELDKGEDSWERFAGECNPEYES